MGILAKESGGTRIALCAQSFGFGPASKAAAIAVKMLELFPRTKVVCCMGGVAREYMRREGIWREGIDICMDGTNFADLDGQVGPVDAAITVLDPEPSLFFNGRAPLYFVDSLGFMWGRSFFDDYPAVRNATRYFVQDAFGAAERLKRLGVLNVEPVGGIVDTQTRPAVHAPDLTINLGGLLNIYPDGPVATYVDGLIEIISRLGRRRKTLVLTSHSAISRFDTLSSAAFEVRPLPHGEALWTFAHSRVVLSSPGLTTLLELISQRVPFLPLPPQNMSQALIIRNIVDTVPGAPDIWRFLADAYPVRRGIDEADGVRIVQEGNARLLSDQVFIAQYCLLAETSEADLRVLPPSIVSDMNGAETICRTVMSDLEKPAAAGDATH